MKGLSYSFLRAVCALVIGLVWYMGYMLLTVKYPALLL